MSDAATPTPTQVHQLAGVTGIDPGTIRRAYGLHVDGRRTRAATLYALRHAAREVGAPPPPEPNQLEISA